MQNLKENQSKMRGVNKKKSGNEQPETKSLSPTYTAQYYGRANESAQRVRDSSKT